jgi:hypothetical protein
MITDGPFSTLTDKQKTFLSALASEQIEYVVFGGYAIRFHGREREAKDLDLLVGYEPVNAKKLLSVLCRLGVPRPGLQKKLTKPKVQIRWHDVELLTSIDGLEFKDVRERASETTTDNLMVRVASAADLLASKRMAARPEDQEDIDFLEKMV